LKRIDAYRPIVQLLGFNTALPFTIVKTQAEKKEQWINSKSIFQPAQTINPQSINTTHKLSS